MDTNDPFFVRPIVTVNILDDFWDLTQTFDHTRFYQNVNWWRDENLSKNTVHNKRIKFR